MVDGGSTVVGGLGEGGGGRQKDVVTASLETINLATVGSIAPHVLHIALPAESIEARIPTTVGLASSILAVLAGVKGDTAALLVAGELPSINGHANSIDCKLGTGGSCK